MSPRAKRIRKVLSPPLIKGFKPYGLNSEKQKIEPITLLYEEYEALRLCDYDMYNHLQASEIMNVSRPTYTRIYGSARQKIAKAFVEGRQVTIEGGKVYFDSDWYHCKECSCFFNNPEKDKLIEHCPLCGSNQVAEYDYDNSHEEEEIRDCNAICICPSCGFEQEHKNGIPCNCEICSKCGGRMKRKGSLNCDKF
ncbi:hypothetical protein CYCD_27780 [Tenuifilaceae bacterium CYCD]|nr:hypothetical protein CYCD_27780 [Tenuifilaceae bacterium CYCD]